MPITLEETSPTFRYTTAEDVTLFLGSLNVAVYGDVTGDGTLDDGAMEQSIKTAEGRVDLHTGGPYSFTDDTAGEVAADVFNAWAYKLTAYEIAAKRGFANADQSAFEKLRDEVILEMKMFRDGETILPGAEGPEDTGETWSGDEPISVLPTVDQYGREVSDPPARGMYWDANGNGYRWS